MSTDIQKYEGTPAARASNWAAMSDEDLRREAIRAAGERNPVRLWELTEAYLVLHNPRGALISPHTLDNYRLGITDFLQQWEGENLLRPTRDAPLQYLRKLESSISPATGRHLAPGTISVKLAAARALYRALRWAGATDLSPFADVRAPRDPTPLEEKREAYPEEDVIKLIEASTQPDRALVLLAAHGGLRIAEILSLTWGNVDMPAGTIRVTGKGRKTRTVHMSSALTEALSELRGANHDPAGAVMPYRTGSRARQRLQDLCNRAGVAYLGVHSLRHSCGTRLYRMTGDLRIAARHLGHSSTTTTQIYAKMDTTKYSEAIAKL